MQSINELAFVLSMTAILAVCVLGTFSDVFDDNLGQRAGMALAALGSSVALQAWYFDHNALTPTNITLGGVAVFGLSTSYKIWRKHAHV